MTASDTSCAFCKYAGPSRVLHREIDGTFVIEPLSPVAEGHVLVISGMHTPSAASEPHMAARVMLTAAWWVKHRVEGPANIITSVGREATQTVEHLHLHVVPRREGDGLALPWTGQVTADV